MYAYHLAVLVLLCVGGHALAAHLHTRALAQRGVQYIHVYLGVMTFTIVWGVALLPPHGLFSGPVWALGVSLPLGFTLGAIAAWGDRVIVRHYRRRALVTDTTPGKGGSPRPRSRGVSSRVRRMQRFPVAGEASPRRLVGVPVAQQTILRSGNYERSGLVALAGVAVLEEIVYRGLLVQVSFLLPGTLLTAVALIASVGLFALAHLVFGWPHVLGKLPLGALALLSVVVLGSVLTAIVAHIVFNVRIWRDGRREPRLPAV